MRKIPVRELKMEDPTFQSGSSHTANVQVRNPTTKALTYAMELYLDVTRKAVSGKSVTVPAGATQSVSFPITMPTEEGTWEVYFDVKVAGELIAHFHATEDVVTEIPPDVDIIDITWE
jgi:hypothetical protein